MLSRHLLLTFFTVVLTLSSLKAGFTDKDTFVFQDAASSSDQKWPPRNTTIKKLVYVNSHDNNPYLGSALSSANSSGPLEKLVVQETDSLKQKRSRGRSYGFQIAAYLPFMPNLKALSIEIDSLDSPQIIVLAAGIETSRLERFTLRTTGAPTPDHMQYLAPAFEKSQTLKAVKFSSPVQKYQKPTLLSDETVELFARAFANKNITFVDISSYGFNKMGAAHLLAALIRRNSPMTLKISDDYYGVDTDIRVAFKRFSENQSEWFIKPQ